ncbi:MAG TPA: histidine kinase dimerization/phosphoacceptor domain -containing protein, partial [Desulfopila sp.]|nr:histidine kinase dimerization/phosphoacceptor domain -containing protein [Desulfopila sp.]
GTPLYQNDLSPSPITGNYINAAVAPLTTVYWGDSQISSSVREELRALTHMTPLFKRVLTENPEVLASHTITASGIGLYCTEREHYKKAASEIPPSSIFDLRDGEPMTIFTTSEEPSEAVRWTNIYKDEVIDGFMLTASAPVYDDTGQFRGITGIDIPLTDVVGDVLAADNDEDEKWLLFSFLLDSDGRIIAFPEKFFNLFGIEHTPSAYRNSSDQLAILLGQSQSGEVRNLSAALIEEAEQQRIVTLEGENYYVVTSRMPKHQWIFGVVARKSDMLETVTAGRGELDQTIGKLAIRSVAFSLATIGIAIVIIFLLIKHLITPLRRLSLATEQVTAGNLNVHCPVTTNDEPGTLAASFNSMVIQLRVAQKQQQMYFGYLEEEVAKRSEEVLLQKRELEKTITRLEDEIERRQIVSEALHLSRQKYHDTLESSLAGVYIIEDFKLSYVNSSFAEKLFHTSKKSLIGKSPLEFVTPKDRGRVGANIKLRQLGVNIPPYVLECIRPDGTRFYGEVWSKATTWKDKKVVVGTITDVTVLRQKELRLREQDDELQKSLQEKEMLLREIHHRTKNNMLIIISMLELQRLELDGEQQRTIFQEMENRIRSMALVHEKLYTAQNLNRIDMGSYLNDIARSLLSSMVINSTIDLDLQAEPISIDIDHAVPIGLVVNEIITNAIKHAFPKSRRGTISVTAKRTDNSHLHLIIADDGIGLPEDIDILATSSFGTGIIISGLVKMQLKGEITVERGMGTTYHIRFLDPILHKRL